MKIGDIVYYVDKEMKFYFDVKIINIIRDKEHNTNLYECQILGNNYKFLNNEFEFKNDRIGETTIYTKLNLCKSLEEAESLIN